MKQVSAGMEESEARNSSPRLAGYHVFRYILTKLYITDSTYQLGEALLVSTPSRPNISVSYAVRY